MVWPLVISSAKGRLGVLWAIKFRKKG